MFEETKNKKITKTSESIAQIAKALSQFQLEVTNPANTATNPYYKSKYAPLSEVLNEVRPLLGKYGLAVIQNSYNEGEKVSVTTLLIHESGEWIEADPIEMKPEKSTPQGVGAVITYGRRYTLSAVLGISSEEDDDGNINEPKDKNKTGKKSSNSEESEISVIRKKITGLAQTKAGVNDTVKGAVKEILAKYHSSGNPNKIEDIEEAKKCLDEINNIKVGVK